MAPLLVESSVCYDWIFDSADTGKASQLEWNEIWFLDNFVPRHRQRYPAFPGNCQDKCRITASCGAGLIGKMEKRAIMPLHIIQTLLINTSFKNIRSLQLKTLGDIHFQSSLAKYANKKLMVSGSSVSRPNIKLSLHTQLTGYIFFWKMNLFLLHTRLVDIIH